MSRPQGQPGTFAYGCTTFPAMLDRDGRYHWQGHATTRWYEASPGLARLIERRFEPDDVPEWVTLCRHERICFTESECTQLLLEEPRDD